MSNPFQGLSRESLAAPASALSLSVYTRPDTLARPSTANVNILHGIKGLETFEVDEAGQPIYKEEVKGKMPDFEVPEGCQMMARTGQE